jgi:hypothetical protein
LKLRCRNDMSYVGVLSALAANLCPFSGRREGARFCDDFGEPVGEAVEATARSAVWQRPAKHLEHMLSGKQRIDQTIEASSGSERRLGLWNKMARFGTSYLEFPLEVSQRHVEIAHGHLGRSVAE